MVTFFEGGAEGGGERKEGCHGGAGSGCGVHTYMQVVTQQLSPSPFFTRTPLFVLTQMHTCGEGGRGGGAGSASPQVCAHEPAHILMEGFQTKYIEGKGLSKTKKARDSAPRTAPVCTTGEEILQAYKQRGFFGGGEGRC